MLLNRAEINVKIDWETSEVAKYAHEKNERSRYIFIKVTLINTAYLYLVVSTVSVALLML